LIALKLTNCQGCPVLKNGVVWMELTKMDNEKGLWKELWDKCIFNSKNPLCTGIRDRLAQLQSLGWRYPVCPTDSRIDIMFVGINPRKNTNVKIEYKKNDFEVYYEESKRKEFMGDPSFAKIHKPLLQKIKEEGYHPTSFFTEVILCPTDGVRGLGKKAEDIANTCTSNYLKELIKIEMPKVIVAGGNLPVTTIREQFGLPYKKVQVTKNENIGKKEIICVDHNNLCLIWCPHQNAHIPKKVISKKEVIERICREIVSILKVS
jgi:hypothetical protein